MEGICLVFILNIYFKKSDLFRCIRPTCDMLGFYTENQIVPVTLCLIFINVKLHILHTF